jgi:hypothetical protein
MGPIDLLRLKVRPLEERRSLTRVEDILIPTDRPPAPLSSAQSDTVGNMVEAIRSARKSGAPVIRCMGPT